MTETKNVFMIIDKSTDEPVGVYSRAYHDIYEFSSKEKALNANCHGIHKDESKFEVVEDKVFYRRVL